MSVENFGSTITGVSQSASTKQIDGLYSNSQAVANQIINDLVNFNTSSSGVQLFQNGQAFQSGNTLELSQSGNLGLNGSYYSQIEQMILNARVPSLINETEIINVNGQTGIWANKQEVLNWKGVIPITQYVINEDANPEVIRKRTEQVLTYEQEIAIRYLRPPTPPPPGEIVIRQEKNIVTPPAIPLVIRQQPPRPETPAPLIIREAPPRPPAAIGQKVITISGKRLPPPPRKVIIERLAPLPSKPQSCIIERWLPYSQTKRRVIFQKSTEADPVIPRPRNVVIQWEAPEIRVRKEYKDLGVIRANPVEYVQRYGATLKQHVDLPDFVRQIKAPKGVILAAEYNAPPLYELEGDVQALRLIDLDREGLGEYTNFVALIGGSSNAYEHIVQEIAEHADSDSDSRVSIDVAVKAILRLNTILGRHYTREDALAYLRSLNSHREANVDFHELKNALLSHLIPKSQ